MTFAVIRTRPFTDGQRHRWAITAADRAGLAAGKLAIRHDHGTAGQGCLVLQLAAKLVEADVADGARQLVICRHPFNVQVFDADQAKAPGQAGGRFVQEVLPDMGYAVWSFASRAADWRRLALPFCFRLCWRERRFIR